MKKNLNVQSKLRKAVRIFTFLLCIFALQIFIQAQTLKADYQFQGNLNSSVAGAPAMTNLTGSGANSFSADTVDGYARQTLRFPFNSGVSVSTAGLIPNNAYTIVMLFRFDEISGFRRVASFDNGTTDNGAYMQDGRLEFESTANAAIFPNTYIQVVIVREASGLVRAYRDGGFRVNVANDGGAFQISGANILRFFQDDVLAPTEASAGNVARIRLYDAPMTTTQVRLLDRLPNVGGGDQPILFVTGRDGFNEIYTMNADGSNQRRLTFNEITEINPKWSPDKTKIVYSRRETSADLYQIWVMNADGSGQTRLTNSPTVDQNPVWKPDGSKILFSRCTTSGVCDLFTMNPDGSGQAAIPLVNTTGDEDQADFSPDGTKIIFACGTNTFANENICLANADGSSRQQLTNTVSPVSNAVPVYSPNGAKIAFERQSNSADQFTTEIFVMDSNGANQTNLTNNAFFESSPHWSPDGSRLAFSSQRESVFVEAYTMNAANGSSVVRLTVNSVGDVPTDWYRPSTRRAPFDFDGDGKTDIGIFRPAPGEWWYSRSSDNLTSALQFGQSSDKITPGDFTGDGRSDIAFWRPSNGFWYVLRSEDNSFFSFPFGASGDIPAPADYDGDGKTDAAVFRPSSTTWFIRRSSDGGTTITNFGIAEDKPVVADYDGDGKADIAIFRPSVGEWWYQRSSNGIVAALQFGTSTDKPVPADYTGDGKADIAFFRPSTGFWFILRSEDASFFSFPFGTSGDIPVAGDYDGDGKTDTAVFRPSSSTWYVNRTTSGILITTYGISGDQPIPSAFVP